MQDSAATPLVASTEESVNVPADTANANTGVVIAVAVVGHVKKQQSRRALCCSFVTLLMSIPALIGA